MSAPENFAVRVYYEDTDLSGNVYHAAYLKFLERARTEWLRRHGMQHSELLAQGLAFAVRNMEIWFDAPARIDDELMVSTSVKSTSGARMVLDQVIMRRGAMLTRAAVTIVMISASGRPVRLPAMLRTPG